MDASRFDRISKAFADRKVSRRRAILQAGTAVTAGALTATGVAATASQLSTPDATPNAIPEATPDPTGAVGTSGPTMLFLQTFQAGTIDPIPGSTDRYTLTLEAGTGQTIYFSDRPDRVVGTNPTADFLQGLGFPEDNPPNAALVMETGTGETDIAVVELFAPTYDPLTQGVTYEVEVLANWENSLVMGFQEAPTDLAAVVPSFGAAQLFIDDCPDGTIRCHGKYDRYGGGTVYGTIANEEHSGYCYNWVDVQCLPCEPWLNRREAIPYWGNLCQQRFPECGEGCRAFGLCSSGLVCS